jgi:N-acyl-D-amino-acid deacylase
VKRFDLLIRGGAIIDGSGKPGMAGDVAIRGGRIIETGARVDPADADRVIDADGLVVSPGFIDTHTHDDAYILYNPQCPEKVFQGVTTVVVGNCGFSIAPVVEARREALMSFLGLLGVGHVDAALADVVSVSDYLDRVEASRPSLNVLALAGHQTIRIGAMGLDNRSPSPDEREKMKKLAKAAMADGAFGFSTGLNYSPGAAASIEELVEIARVVAGYGGLYATHLRDEAANQGEAIEEALAIARQSGIRAHISHHKVIGKPNWGQSREHLARIEAARDNGLQITCDQYPYTAGSTFLAAVLPPFLHVDGPDAFAEKLKDPELRQAARAELEGGPLSIARDIGLENVVISVSPSRPHYVGRSLADIVRDEGQDPYDVVFDLAAADKMEAMIVVHMMNEDDLKTIMRAPFTMIGSDGIPGFGQGQVHPRFTGAFPRVLGRYVREARVLKLEEAVRRMTSLPAQTFGIKNKGLIREGFDADLVIFYPQEIADKSTYESPLEKPDGIHWVIVNGEITAENSQMTDAAAGSVLRFAG